MYINALCMWIKKIPSVGVQLYNGFAMYRYLNGEKIVIKDELEVDGVERIVVVCPTEDFSSVSACSTYLTLVYSTQSP
jgi:hypothetical protein